MTLRTLIYRSLRFHARSHLGTLLGAALASAVLIGALVVGDSVRGSLRDFALLRLGGIQSAMVTGDRLITRKSVLASAVLQLPAIASKPDGSARANRVQLLGVDEGFWGMSPDYGPPPDPILVRYLRMALWRLQLWLHITPKPVVVPTIRSLREGKLYLNRPLAAHLSARLDDTVLLRVQKPSFLSQENPLAPQEDTFATLRLKVGGVLEDTAFGRFSLKANETEPFNAFITLDFLNRELQLLEDGDRFANPGDTALAKGNLFVTSGNTAFANDQFNQYWNLWHCGFELHKLHDTIDLRSKRIFLDPPVERAARKLFPNCSGVLTYFVNELRDGQKTTPYSMVTAAEAPFVPANMHDDEILLNQWLADDLQAKPGDRIQLRYYILGTSKRLDEQTNSFRVRAIVPLDGVYADRELMPEFPGLAKAESTHNWDAGSTIDMKKIRPKDEDYWKKFRGTPKAFVTLAAGKKMWANRFGDLTAIRFPRSFGVPPSGGTAPPEGGTPNLTRGEITAALEKEIDPASLGLRFENVRESALAASSQSEDFGGLFLGFSFFLIVAALILMALLFQFSLEQRATEVGTLLALGFHPRQVRRLLLLEGATLALVGGIIGLLGGIAYARGILYGLTTIWHSAVGTSALQFHVSGTTLLIGLGSSLFVSIATVWLALRSQAKRPARELLAQGAELEQMSSELKSEISNPKSEICNLPSATRHLPSTSQKPARRFALLKSKITWSKWIAALSGISGLGLVASALVRHDTADTETFFGGGALLLICGIAAAAVFLRRLAGTKSEHFSFGALALRGCARRRKRSLATVALLASGSFLIVAVSANKLDANRDSTKRSSGTGGFALLGESTLPIVQDLNSKAGREFFGLDLQTFNGVEFVPLRVRDGDDASCLNLNRAQKPRVLGVNPDLLASRHAFTFSHIAKGLSADSPWLLLKHSSPNEIPAIADEASIVWALGKKVGDTLDYVDERGNSFKVRLVGALANSILQGSLLIDEAAFVKKFPGESGYRMFLIDAPSNRAAEISSALSRATQDVGLELTPAAQRLAAFNAVQNTYLDTFQILGGLGLLLGSVGLGVVVLRNVLERRGELAVLLAVGFRQRMVRRLVLAEHSVLLVVGLCIGIGAALFAVLPGLLSPGAPISFSTLALTLGAVFLFGLISSWIAAQVALRGELLEALRNN